MIDATAVARLREQHAAATPGEWGVRISELTTTHEVTVYDANYDCTGVVALCNSGLRSTDNEPNVRFIAAAHNALPDVLDALEQAWRERDALTAELAQVRGELAAALVQVEYWKDELPYGVD